MLLIETTLRALGIDTDWNPYSGLMIEEFEDGTVKIYDDYVSGIVVGKDFERYLLDSETIQKLHKSLDKDRLIQEIWWWVSANDLIRT